MHSSAAPSITVDPLTDVLGFGKNGEKTYQEAWDKEPGYCIWTINKFQELVKLGDELATPYTTGESKMKRFAQWLIKTEEALEARGPVMEYNDNMELVPKAGSETLAQRAGKILAGNAEKFYAVACPSPAVYTSWAECKPHVVGVKGVMYKSFPTREEAEAYVKDPPARASRASKRPQEAQEPAVDAELAEPKKRARKSAKADAAVAETSAAVEDEETTASTRKVKAAKAPKSGELDNAEPSPQKPTPEKAAKQTGRKRKGQTADENTSQTKAAAPQGEVTPTKPAKSTRNEKVVSETESKLSKSSETPSSAISEDVSKKADGLGMTGALRNLMSRSEIMSLGLSADKVLDALVHAEGLVNKAKNALLANDPSTPVKGAVVAASGHETTRVTPEKSDTTKDSLAGASEPGKEVTLSAMQKGRIELNRELALARKAQKP